MATRSVLPQSWVFGLRLVNGGWRVLRNRYAVKSLRPECTLVGYWMARGRYGWPLRRDRRDPPGRLPPLIAAGGGRPSARSGSRRGSRRLGRVRPLAEVRVAHEGQRRVRPVSRDHVRAGPGQERRPADRDGGAPGGAGAARSQRELVEEVGVGLAQVEGDRARGVIGDDPGGQIAPPRVPAGTLVRRGCLVVAGTRRRS